MNFKFGNKSKLEIKVRVCQSQLVGITKFKKCDRSKYKSQLFSSILEFDNNDAEL